MSSKANDIPQIVISEPSTSIQNPSVVTKVSVQESAFTSQNGCVEDPQMSPAVEICSPPELDAASIAPSEQIPPIAEIERPIEDEFSPAEACKDCVVSVQESRSESEPVDTTPDSSESDADEFRTYRCCRLNFGCKEAYIYVSYVLGHRYSIPVWLILMALPLSAGIMGSIYMFSCPACVALPNTMFMMGISMMALLTLHVCIIIHKFTSENENFRLMLRTLKLICVFISMLFYLTESVSYWKMESSEEEGSPKYCNPTFTNFAFWWNITISVLLAIVALFPMA